MSWAASFAREHKQWFLAEIEKLCSDPDYANALHIKGQCDMELCIVVRDTDRSAFTHEVLARLEEGLKQRTGVTKPVIYLDGHRPTHLDNPDYWDL